MDLPAILAGPIIRRVEPKQACIWIATSEAYQLHATLYSITEIKHGRYDYTQLTIHVEVESIAFGDHLFIYLLRITAKSGTLPTDALLGYNIMFEQGSKVFDLQSFGLLSPQNPHSLVYGNLKYPTFIINTSEDTQMLYASCRKLHGKGDDSLANADLLLNDYHANLKKRPHTLFFIGDQIYADDVPDPIILFLSTLGKQLLGKSEHLDTVDNRLHLDTFREALERIHGRQYIMEQFAAFTSKNAHNHVIAFSEFAALYLLSWSPEIWELAEDFGVFDSYENIEDDYYFVYGTDEKKHAKERQQHEARFIEQLESVDRFKQTVSYVRRVMANTSTYMIFDDHDITDDWNLTQSWKKHVYHSNLGRHVMANGLTAYWAFQGWGNDPDRFDTSFKQITLSHFKDWNFNSSSYEKWIDQYWNFQSWFFITPTTPKAVMLDTRTMRAYDPLPRRTTVGNMLEELPKSPQLISQTGWELISDRLMESGWKKGSRLLVISATPLYGIGLIESFLDKYVYPLRSLGFPVQQMIDFEAWKYNGEGFNQCIQQIAAWQPSACFILSGDVHYASSVHSQINFANNNTLSLYQFTSSPAKNQSFFGMWGALMKRIVAINAKKRKRKTINRFCDENNGLYIEDPKTVCPPTYQWKETISYLPAKNGEIMQIDNNIGYITLSSTSIHNTLLHYYGLYCKENRYENINVQPLKRRT